MDEVEKLIFPISKKIFFLGICGIGMSAIAQYLKKSFHCTITGSDKNINNNIAKILKEQNIIIHLEEDVTENMIDNIDLIVITNIIFTTNRILEIAKKKHKKIISRSKILKLILQEKKVIGVTGSHGKTTTCGLITKIFVDAKLSPFAFVGGIMHEFKSNFIFGDSDYAIVEADDAFKSFLDLKPLFSVITNISCEHLETYVNLEDIKNNFLKYAHLTDPKGKIIINIDNEIMKEIASRIDHPGLITYGFVENADYIIKNIFFNHNKSYFELYKKNIKIETFTLNLSGIHNIKNATAAIIVALENNISINSILESLNTHNGIKRRFEFLGKTKEGICIYDDYGHHPVEIDATLSLLEIKKFRYVYIFFQFHRYSRTKSLWHDFLSVFIKYKNLITKLYITDIYTAGEILEDKQYNSFEFVNSLNSRGLTATYIPYSPYFENFFTYSQHLIEKKDTEKDMILTLGAGVMNDFAELLIKKSVE